MKSRVSFVPLMAGGILLFAAGAFAQNSAPPAATTVRTGSASSSAPVFAVASIRLHQGPLRVFEGFTASGPRLTLEGYNLRGLVGEAYNLRNYRVSFAGSNLGSDEQSDTNYDISAVAEGNDSPTREEFREMLQALLANRFKLRLHRETKEMPVYALVVAKDGPKFKESTPDEVVKTQTGPRGRNQMVVASKKTMESFAEDIMQGFQPQLPVIDKTGLTGSYDIKLEATPEYRIDNNPQPEDISLFDAVEEQLGLRLQRQQGAVDVLVVDHVEKPSEN
jgi:uncharacterized protein (TIGR03435 family)